MRSQRRRRFCSSGQGMVEFSMVAPLAFLTIFSLIGVGLMLFNQNRLTDTLRDAVRAGAVCGSQTNPNTDIPGTVIACNDSNWQSWTISQLKNIDGGYDWAGNTTFTVITEHADGTTSTVPGDTGHQALNPNVPLDCSISAVPPDVYVQITLTYNQPVLIPIVGQFFANGPNDTRKLQSTAQALCEQ